MRKFWVVLYFLVPNFLFGWSGISAVSSGHPEILIFSGFSTKKYLGTFSRSLLFRRYRDSIGAVMFVFRIPRLRMNSLIAFGWMPRSFRD